MKICIDAGHGGNDSGAVGVGKRLEKSDALRMANALDAEMRARGWSTIMTRTTDKTLQLSDRTNLANSASADVFVALHRNASNGQGHGLEVLYRTAGTSKSNADNARSIVLAQNIDARCVAATGYRDRGAKAQNTNTYVLQKTKMPAVTVEAGFVDNAGDNATFDRTFDALITAIADGIEATYGTTTGTPTPPAPAQPVKTLPYTFSDPYCREGETGERVLWVQTRLGPDHHNAKPGKLDGVFGPTTKGAVKRFQAARKNEGRDIGAVDGIVGPKTAAILAE